MNIRDSLTRIGAIAAKEVRQLRRDRQTGGMIVGIPLFQILIFGYGINLDVRHLQAGYVDYAQTSASRALLGDLQATQVVQFVERAHSSDELRRPLAAGKIAAGIYIPPDFERRRIEGDRPVAQLFVDGSEPGIEGALRALASLPLRARAGDVTSPHRVLEVLTEYNP